MGRRAHNLHRTCGNGPAGRPHHDAPDHAVAPLLKAAQHLRRTAQGAGKVHGTGRRTADLCQVHHIEVLLLTQPLHQAVADYLYLLVDAQVPADG